MQRLAIAMATGAVLAALLPSPGQFLALGLALSAIGVGWVAYRERAAPGTSRLVAAAAITIGGVALLLGALRVVLVLAAIGRIDALLG